MDDTATGRRDIFRYRPYLLYFIGHTGSMLGTGMQFIANSWLAMELTGKGHSVAFVLVATSLPGILLSPFIGIYVDRFDRKLLAVATDVFRALMLLVVPALWYLGLLQPWHLYLMSFFIALGDEIYAPTVMGLIREVIPPEMLLYANSTTTIALQIGMLAGAALGGVIIHFTSPIAVMFINAVTFVFSGICIWFMRKGRVLPKTTVAQTKGFRQFIEELWEGIGYIRVHTQIIVLYTMMAFIRSTLYAINVLLAPFAKNVIKVGAVGFGYIDAAFAIGAIAGNFLLPIVTRLLGAPQTLTVGMWAIGACLYLFAASQGLFMAMVSYFLLGVAFQVGVLYMTRAQQNTDLSYQGRVHSTFNTIFAIISLAVYLAMGFLGEQIPIRTLYVFQGSLMAVSGLIAFQWIYRKWKSQARLQELEQEAESHVAT